MEKRKDMDNQSASYSKHHSKLKFIKSAFFHFANIFTILNQANAKISLQL